MEDNGSSKKGIVGKKKTKGGRRWREKQKKKREEEQENKTRQILFLGIQGDLVGIDLSSSSSSSSSTKHHHTSPPPLAPICCRLELSRYGYPFCMRHIKLKDKVYLLGGAFFEPTLHGIDGKGWLGFSDKLYHFHYSNSILNNTNYNNNDNFVDPCHVLTPLPATANLREPKFALVANLRGTFYALHSWIHSLTPVVLPKDPNFSFERFDPVSKSWHQAPTPPIYHQRHQEWLLHNNHAPVEFYHFVVDDKLLLACDDDALLVFSHLSQEWEEISYSHYICQNFSTPLSSIHDPLPTNSLWLSNFDFINYDSLGVLLFIGNTGRKCFYGFRWSRICRRARHNSYDFDPCFLYTYTVYAYAMCKTKCKLKFYQQFDGIFSDMLPTCTPLNLVTVGYHLLDLGNQEDNQIKRTCAILTGDGLTNGISYLFISIFDLRIAREPLASTYPVESYEFLEYSTVKKLVFRLNKHHGIHAYNTNKLWLEACDTPPLDAFLLQV